MEPVPGVEARCALAVPMVYIPPPVHPWGEGTSRRCGDVRCLTRTRVAAPAVDGIVAVDSIVVAAAAAAALVAVAALVAAALVLVLVAAAATPAPAKPAVAEFAAAAKHQKTRTHH